MVSDWAPNRELVCMIGSTFAGTKRIWPAINSAHVRAIL
jgi:hypothetical protein